MRTIRGNGRKTWEQDNRFQDYLSAYCFKKLGMDERADESSQKIAEYTLAANPQEQDPLNLFISLNTMRTKGKKNEADNVMERWKHVQDSLSVWNISSGSSSPKARWLIARYYGNGKEVDELEKEIISTPGENRFRLIMNTYYHLNKSGK